ncbi:MAG: Gx transporter family protein [Clostridiales bacterium]|nr:Gx transporter family protein [Clostridiales bacterium]
MSGNRDIALYAVFTSLALVLSYFEAMLPPFIVAVPGIKLGLANIVVIIFLYLRPSKYALFINLTRILIMSVAFSGVFGLIYSFSGAILSFLVMLIFKKSNLFGIIGVSTVGSVFHNIGQIFVAAVVLQSSKLFLYMPVLIISGVVSGIITGFIAGGCIARLKVGGI